MKSGWLILILSLLLPSFAMAQERELEPVDDAAAAIGSILGNNAKGITSVRVLADTEETLTVQVTYDGFDDGPHTITGAVLNRIKKPLKDVESESQTLRAGSGTTELTFRFRQQSRGYSGSHIDSDFLSLTVAKEDAFLSKLDLGSDLTFGDTYLFKLGKQWRVKGSESMVIQVKLTPYKSAATITP